MKILKVLIPIVILVGILALVKIKYLTPAEGGAPGPGKGQAPATPVTVFVTHAETVDNSIFASGTILANEAVDLSTEVSGKIVSLNIPEGGRVSKGTLLLKINDAELQAQLRKQELQVKIANEKAARLKQLLSIQGVSQEEYDQALNTANTAMADADYTRALIARTELRAPFNGVLGLRQVSEGAYITPNTIITTIQQVNPVKMDFPVPERYAAILKQGDPLTFTVDGSKTIYKARLSAVPPNVQSSSRMITVRALADNASGSLMPGAFAKVELPLQKMEHSIMIPTEAIIPVLKGKKVFICQGGKAKECMVETGLRTDTQVQVVSGLNEGDSVITTGIMQLKPGTALKILNK